MNCCLLLLFLLFCNNGSCGSTRNRFDDCGCGGILNNDNDCGCGNANSDRDYGRDGKSRNDDCGCGNMNIPPSWARTNFNDTCGCEEK